MAGWVVDWCLTALSAQTGYIVLQSMKYISVGLGDKRQTHNTTMKQHNKLKVISTLQPRLCGDNLFTTYRRPQRSLSSQSLGKY